MVTKPYDCIAVTDEWVTLHMELKIIEADSINIEKLRPNQHASLKHISKFAPDSAVVWVYSKKHKEYILIQYLEFRSRANESGTVKLFDK